MNRRVGVVRTWARPRVVWSVAIALVLGAAIFWLSQPRRDDAAVDATSALRVPAVVVDAAVVLEQKRDPGAEPPVELARASGSELVEVCGVGWVEPDASGAWDPAAVKAVPDVLASQRAIVEAIRGDGELGAAIATVLELHGAGRENDGGTPASALLCDERDCATSAQDRQIAAGLVDQLARQAAVTNDPRVYALAMRECGRALEQGSCALLNLAQWARLDDGNALPWLHILARARQRNDAAQIQEALYRIGMAARMEDRVFETAGAVADHVDASDVDLIAAQLLATDAFMQAAASTAPFQPLASVCSVAALADANRRQACDAAAATLAERSTDLGALAVGTSLGRRLGWPDDRVDRRRALLHARAAMARDDAASAGVATAVDLPNSCRGARRVLSSFSQQGRSGEVQFVADWLNASGTKIAPFVEQAHAEMRKRDSRESANVAGVADAASAAPPVDAAAAAAPPAAASAAVAFAPDAATPYSEAPPPSR